MPSHWLGLASEDHAAVLSDVCILDDSAMATAASPAEKVSFTSLEFTNFKAFTRYSVSLQSMNILVGPNNSGKSTIIGAFRALDFGLRKARSRNPERVSGPRAEVLGYNLSQDLLPISIENVHTDYADTDTTVSFRLSNGNKLVLFFPRDGGCVLIPEPKGRAITTTTTFKTAFPISIAVVPVLGPVEHNEQLLKLETVQKDLGTHRASRHFRNYWHHFPTGFSEFASLLEKTWPGMQIQAPERSGISTALSMFCLEDRMTRELYWAGFGFQIWCQLLTHLSRATQSSMLLVDEPEVYLHPDVQRQLLTLMRSLGPDILLATHSTEILGEADPSEIALIDKSKPSANRLRDVEGVQKVLDDLGSIQNITLTRLAKNKRVLFVEGVGDYFILRSFARQLDLPVLGAGTEITSLVSEGFSSWEKISSLGWGLQKVLGQNIHVAVIYDRDYWCSEDVDERLRRLRDWVALAHVHQRKEIENYLLVIEPLERALWAAAKDKQKRTGEEIQITEGIEQMLETLTVPLKGQVQSQYVGRRVDYLRRSAKDSSSIIAETNSLFDARWSKLSTRLEIVPGKETLRFLRERVQQNYGITLTDQRIIASFKAYEIPSDFTELLKSLDRFRSGE